MEIEIPNLFHFVATFESGEQIFQDETDSSLHTEGKNAMWDVLEKRKTDPLISFVIAGGGLTFGVDLRDGHFEINGIPFFQHRPEFADQRYTGFALEFFRTPRVEFDMGTKETRGSIKSYTLGWKATDPNGLEVVKTITAYL